MAHSHHESLSAPSVAALERRRSAMKLMIIVLVPIAVWTLVALIVTWPRHVEQRLSPAAQQVVSTVRAKVTDIALVNCDDQSTTIPPGAQPCANLSVEVLNGPETGQTVQVPLQAAKLAAGVKLGDVVHLYRAAAPGAPAGYSFAEYERSWPMVILALLFVIAVVAVARLRGFMALVGLGFAAVILVKYLFPALLVGQNPVLVGLIGSTAIMFVVIYTAHGFSVRSTTALTGTLFGLLISAGLGWLMTRWARLSGIVDDGSYLLSSSAPSLQLNSVVMCGIIVAGLGVLNDVTITQASAVWELAETSEDHRRLFRRAMRIGRDHIASTVYTIAFATAGGSLGTLLLIAVYQRPLLEILRTEIIATDVIQTLVGAIALILAVPVTTAIGVAAVKLRPTQADDPDADDPELDDPELDDPELDDPDFDDAASEEPKIDEPTIGRAGDDQAGRSDSRHHRGSSSDDQFKRPRVVDDAGDS